MGVCLTNLQVQPLASRQAQPLERWTAVSFIMDEMWGHKDFIGLFSGALIGSGQAHSQYGCHCLCCRVTA